MCVVKDAVVKAVTPVSRIFIVGPPNRRDPYKYFTKEEWKHHSPFVANIIAIEVDVEQIQGVPDTPQHDKLYFPYEELGMLLNFFDVDSSDMNDSHLAAIAETPIRVNYCWLDGELVLSNMLPFQEN